MDLSCRRLIAGSLIAAAALLAAGPADAASLYGDAVTVTLASDDFGPFSAVVMPGAGLDVSQADGSDIGDFVNTGEFVDIDELAIHFAIFGGDITDVIDDSGPNRYLGTGLGLNARYELTGLFGPAEAIITGASVSVLDVDVNGTPTASVFAAPQVTFGLHSITLLFEGMGVLEYPENVGLLTVNLQIQDLTPVPEPGTLMLLGAGAAAVAARRRRLQSRSSSHP